jgi:hypothetical protein
MKSPDALKNNLMFYNNVLNSFGTRRYSDLANIFAIYLESLSITIIGHSGLTSDLKLVDDGKPRVAMSTTDKALAYDHMWICTLH